MRDGVAVAACPRCGYDNDDAAGFCSNPDCRADLRLVAAPSAASSGVTAPPAAAPPPRDQKRGAKITIEQGELSVEPGGAATTTVKVRNRGTRVEQFRLAVDGAVGQFAQVQPPTLSVYPDDEQSAIVTFTVPRGPRPSAGDAPFQVVARSDVYHDVADTASGVLTVGRFDQLRADLEPEATRGHQPGRHRIAVTNAGNAPIQANIDLADRDGQLTFEPDNFTMPIAPGATEAADVLVAGPLKWLGRAVSMPFTATVNTPTSGAPVLLNGTRRQLPRFPWWVAILALALIALLIALLIAGLALIGPATVPQGGGGGQALMPNVVAKPVAQARAEVDSFNLGLNLGLRVVVTQVPSTQLDGQVIAQDPAAGSPVARGATVTLSVARRVIEDPVSFAASFAAWGSSTAPLTFPGRPGDTDGFVLVHENATAEDQSVGPALETTPPNDPGAFITGQFAVQPSAPGARLRADVGFLQTGFGVVNFIVRVNGQHATTVPAAVPTGHLHPIDVALPPGTTQIEIEVENIIPSGGAIWKNLRIDPS